MSSNTCPFQDECNVCYYHDDYRKCPLYQVKATMKVIEEVKRLAEEKGVAVW